MHQKTYLDGLASDLIGPAGKVLEDVNGECDIHAVGPIESFS